MTAIYLRNEIHFHSKAVPKHLRTAKKNSHKASSRAIALEPNFMHCSWEPSLCNTCYVHYFEKIALNRLWEEVFHIFFPVKNSFADLGILVRFKIHWLIVFLGKNLLLTLEVSYALFSSFICEKKTFNGFWESLSSHFPSLFLMQCTNSEVLSCI